MLPRCLCLRVASLFAYFLAFLPLGPVERNLAVINSYRRQQGKGTFCKLLIKRKYLYYSFKNIIDFFKFMVQSPQSAAALVKFEGAKDEFHRLYEQQKGLIGVCLHMGNWELGGVVLGNMGVSFHTLFFRQLNPVLDYLINRVRRKCKMGLLHQRDGLKKAFKLLKQGEMITFLGDQDGTRNGFFQQFFGLHCSFPRTINSFVNKTEAAVMPMAFLHDPDGDGYIARFYSELQVNRTEEGKAALFGALRDYYEELIQNYPEQWLLFYDRFKFRHDQKLRNEGIYDQVRAAYEEAWRG